MGAAGVGEKDPFFDNVSLLLHGDGTDGSTTFTDSGPYGLTPTVNGNTQIDTAQSKFGGASILFDGSGDYLVYDESIPWQLTGDYTIEFWMRIDNSDVDQFDCVIGNWEATNDDAWLFFLNAYGAAGISFWVADVDVGNAFLSSTTNVHDGTWHNIAVSYDGTTTRLFVDGIVEASSTAAYTITAANTNKLHIGTQGQVTTRTILGHLDEIRITKGVCRYTGNYTVETKAFPEGATGLGSTPLSSLLIHADGADTSTTFTDDSSNSLTITANGNAQVDTAQSKFGGASCLLDGAGDYLVVTGGSAMDFGTEDFTIDFWIRPDALSGTRMLWDQRTTAAGNYVVIYHDGTTLACNNNNTQILTHQTALTTATWQHVALTRGVGVTRLFLDGVVSTTTYNDSNSYSNGNGPYIGAYPLGGPSLFFNGWIDELRVVVGTDVWNGTFTPPTAPYTS